MTIAQLREQCTFVDFEIKGCIISGEYLALRIEQFNSEDKAFTYYHTIACIPGTMRVRYESLFLFNASSDHKALHRYCVHTLYYDDDINFYSRYKELGGIEITH